MPTEGNPLSNCRMVLEVPMFRRTLAVVRVLTMVFVDAHAPAATGLRNRYWEQTDAVPGPPRDPGHRIAWSGRKLRPGLQIVLGAQGPSPAGSEAHAAGGPFAAVWERGFTPGAVISSAGGLFGRATSKQPHSMRIYGAYVVRGRGFAYFPNAVDRSGS